MIPTPETSPFGDDDLARLEALLYDHVGDGDGMPLEAVDGLFSALIVGPEPVLPDEALPQVLGDGEAAPELVELLRKLSQQSNTKLADVAERLIALDHPPS